MLLEKKSNLLSIYLAQIFLLVHLLGFCLSANQGCLLKLAYHFYRIYSVVSSVAHLSDSPVAEKDAFVTLMMVRRTQRYHRSLLAFPPIQTGEVCFSSINRSDKSFCFVSGKNEASKTSCLLLSDREH